MAKTQFYGTGRRKTSIARVRLVPGKGTITINKRDVEEYFGHDALIIEVKRPMGITGTEAKFDVIATVKGGGYNGKAGALRHGISRALLQADPELRATLKTAGFLTRDARKVERKKYGLKKARRASQFSKR